jgi:hypothetical protein
MVDKKGKPTPKRKEAQAKLNLSPLSPGASKESKKVLKAQTRIRRMEARAAYMRGEESALPPRDKGQVRKFVSNDYVCFIFNTYPYPCGSIICSCNYVLSNDIYKRKWIYDVKKN